MDYIPYGICDRIRSLLMHKVTRTSYRSELPVPGSMGEIDLEVMPFVIDGVALLVIQPWKRRTWSAFRAFEDDEGDVRVPGKLFLIGKKPVVAQRYWIVPIWIELF
jgi:hypothetical protein